MKNVILTVLILLPLGHALYSQEGIRGGQFSAGVRSTLNTFNEGDLGTYGWGMGGHLSLWLSDRVNTLWYADYIRTDIEGVANRLDYHIGWSVMYYPGKMQSSVLPFIQAGHCFDYTEVAENGSNSNRLDRWSSAIQAGFGADLMISPKVYLALSGQYMFHLGEDVHVHLHDDHVELVRESGVNLESHLLFTLSVNCKLFDLWNY